MNEELIYQDNLELDLYGSNVIAAGICQTGHDYHVWAETAQGEFIRLPARDEDEAERIVERFN